MTEVQSRDQQVRLAAFVWLSQRTDGGQLPVAWGDLINWEYLGTRIPLIGAAGIWKPAALSEPISITTAPLKSGRPAPYDDTVSDEGILEYRYQGTDPDNHFNRGLRRCLEQRLPLIYFHGIEKGLYLASWPAYAVWDDPTQLTVGVALNNPGEVRPDLDPSTVSAAEARYYATLTRQRLHQAQFRTAVLRAYQTKCGICHLKHSSLLDAAHILADADGGAPVVPNGLSLCKIHHAAFDHNIIGIHPRRLVVEVNEAVLQERDGPMLLHGIQEMHGRSLALPRSEADRPDGVALEWRYERFRNATA